MDQSVLDAVKRWPDVPAVYGWLSLTARGEWKLHPLGDAQAGWLGQGISNTQILGFMDRNYAEQPDGAWFFQNGPQRVYVRLDVAPLIVHIDPTLHVLSTHHGTTVQQVLQWFCDETGQLFAKTDCGPARIDDRDLQILAEVLRSPEGLSLFDLFEAFAMSETQQPKGADRSLPTHTLSDPLQQYPALSQAAPLRFLKAADVPCAMHFIPNPGPKAANSTSLGRKIAP